MPVNLSVKNVPDDLAERLRKRAARNRRSLQQELLSILESATGASARPLGGTPGSARKPPMTVEEVARLAKELFPGGTESSVDFIRKMRDSR
ncbi:MAG: hypothetical protein JNM50_08325 [Chromatiales bacterium]|nr:hypothetical protein [Chromatiales bacterium]